MARFRTAKAAAGHREDTTLRRERPGTGKVAEPPACNWFKKADYTCYVLKDRMAGEWSRHYRTVACAGFAVVPLHDAFLEWWMNGVLSSIRSNLACNSNP